MLNIETNKKLNGDFTNPNNSVTLYFNNKLLCSTPVIKLPGIPENKRSFHWGNCPVVSFTCSAAYRINRTCCISPCFSTIPSDGGFKYITVIHQKLIMKSKNIPACLKKCLFKFMRLLGEFQQFTRKDR